MMHVVALSLVLASLATAGVFSQFPEKQNQGEVIVKEGHRKVVVEFEREDGTKVSICPQKGDDAAAHGSTSDDQEGYVSGVKERVEAATETAVGDVKDKIKEASSVLPDGHRASPRELVCDAFGKCKHKIAVAIGRARNEVYEKTKEAEEWASTKVKEIEKGGQEISQQMNQHAQEISEEAGEWAVSKAKDIEEGAKDTTQKVKQQAEEKAKEAEELAEQTVSKAKGIAHKMQEYVVSNTIVDLSLRVIHLLGFSTAYGMCVWVTFVSSYVLAGTLPRQQFGMVQSKMYPVYFNAMVYSVGAALFGHCLRQGEGFLANRAERFQCCLLLASLSMHLVNLLFLEPKATKVMLARMKIEKEEFRGRLGGSVAEPAPAVAAAATSEEMAIKSEMVRLSHSLKRLNSYSSFLNIMSLMALSWHLVYLVHRMQR